MILTLFPDKVICIKFLNKNIIIVTHRMSFASNYCYFHHYLNDSIPYSTTPVVWSETEEMHCWRKMMEKRDVPPKDVEKLSAVQRLAAESDVVDALKTVVIVRVTRALKMVNP